MIQHDCGHGSFLPSKAANEWIGRKVELQRLADETGLTIHVRHYPPGTSKWNKIEHRLFCRITQNWRGRPLTDRLAIVELIGATTTKTGLKVECALDPGAYEKGVKVSDADIATINLTGP